MPGNSRVLSEQRRHREGHTTLNDVPWGKLVPNQGFQAAQNYSGRNGAGQWTREHQDQLNHKSLQEES